MKLYLNSKSVDSSKNNAFGYSVVATTFNDEKSIERFIREIECQTIPPKEIIVADGGSRDKTVEILKRLKKQSLIPIVVLYGERLNIAEGYNKAIKATSERFVGITGIGNRYESDYFEKLIQKVLEKNIDGAYSPVRGLDANGFSRRYNKQLLNGEYGQQMEIASNHGALLKKSIFVDLNYFYEKFIYAGEDTEFYMLVKEKGYKVEIVPTAVVRWETPENFKDFKRQTRVYSIAGLQIDPITQLKMIIKSGVKIIATVLFIIAWCVMLFLPVDLLVKLSSCVVATIVALFIRNKFKPLRIVQICMQIYYTLTNLKYAKSEYRVRR